MEILFLLVGLIFIAIGVVIVFSEVQARRGTQPVRARVTGFSTGRATTERIPSFYSVAQYTGPDGREYYIEGAVGSSTPLHAVGDSVTVLVSPTQPEKAVFKTALSFAFAAILALMGLASIIAFWFTFQASVYSLAMAVVVAGALALKIKSAWRDRPFSLEAWHEYKNHFSPRVFTHQSKDQISWADPIGVAAAIRSREKSSRFAIPLLLVIGFGALFLSYHSYEKTQVFVGKANQAPGQVVGLRQRDAYDDSTTYSAIVRYRDHEGHDHEFVDSFSSDPPSYHAGQKVSVLYNRENPREAQIDRGRANYWLTFLLGLLGVLFTSLGFFSAGRRRHG